MCTRKDGGKEYEGKEGIEGRKDGGREGIEGISMEIDCA